MSSQMPTVEPPDQFAVMLQRACDLREVKDAYLAAIEDVAPARAYGFYELDPDSGQPLDITARAPEHFLDEYERHGRRDDPVLRYATQEAAPADEVRAASEEEWITSGACTVLSRAGYGHSMEAPLIVGEHTVGTLNFARAGSDRPFDADELARTARASHQMSAALYRAARYEATGERAAMLTEIIEALETPLVVSDLEGEELYTNLPAERRLAGGTQSMVEAARPALWHALQQLRDEPDDCTVSVEPLSGDAEGWAKVRSVRLRSRSEAVVSFLSIEQGDAPPPGVLHLSAREREIAEFVAKGLTTRQMARELFISENTVKQHLKRMFRKLNVHSRAQLVQCLLRPESAGDR